MSELTKALERIRLWQEFHHPDSAAALQPGLCHAEIEDYLKDFPYQLSQEVYELYNWRNGCAGEQQEFFPWYVFLPLGRAIEEYKMIMASAVEAAADLNYDPSKIWHPSWFPVFRFVWVCDYYVIEGRSKAEPASPVLFIFNDDREPDAQYASLTDMMRAVAECYEAGAYFVEEKTAPDGSTYLSLAEDEDQAYYIHEQYKLL